ncbi:MAG: flagellar hook-length control protein FliK [Sulfurospirillum sp.]
MNSLMTLINTNQKVTTPTKEIASNIKDGGDNFISILFSQIEHGTKKPSKLNIQTALIDNTLDKQPKKDNQPKTPNEILLGDILSIIDQLKNPDSKFHFPKFTDKMDKILQNVDIKNDFKNVKSIDDIIKLSKKYNLGLDNIKFTKESIDDLKKDFPKLNFQKFFQSKIDNTQKTGKQTQTLTKSNKGAVITQLLNNQTNKESVDLPKNILQTLLNKTDNETGKVIIKSNEEDKKLKVENYLKDDKKSIKKDNEITVQEKTTVKKSAENVVQNAPDKNLISKKKNEAAPNKQNSIYTTGKEILTKAPLESILRDNKIKSNSSVKKKIDSKDNISQKTSEDTKQHKTTKNTVTNEVRTQEAQIDKNTQDIILQKIKPHKQTKTQTIVETQNKAVNNDLENNSTSENKEKYSEPINHKQEFKTSFQSENIKTPKHIENKSSLNHFANDLKEKMEQYKPPVMKIQMALTPKNLGEVEVTLIHRGNNLHVNIVSNTNTMSLFTQNQAEFKNSLVNMGFTNLEMNFSDQGKNSGQNQQNSRKNRDSFEELQNPDNYENSLELVIPRYI